MSPSNSVKDICYGRVINQELATQPSLAVSPSAQCADFPYLVFGKFYQWITFTPRLSPFVNLIPNVISISAEKQMIGSNTYLYIASMQHMQTLGNWSNKLQKRELMSTPRLSPVFQGCISAVMRPSRPKPTGCKIGSQTNFRKEVEFRSTFRRTLHPFGDTLLAIGMRVVLSSVKGVKRLAGLTGLTEFKDIHDVNLRNRFTKWLSPEYENEPLLLGLFILSQ
jgi:hypothetical protein